MQCEKRMALTEAWLISPGGMECERSLVAIKIKVQLDLLQE